MDQINKRILGTIIISQRQGQSRIRCTRLISRISRGSARRGGLITQLWKTTRQMAQVVNRVRCRQLIKMVFIQVDNSPIKLVR